MKKNFPKNFQKIYKEFNSNGEKNQTYSEFSIDYESEAPLTRSLQIIDKIEQCSKFFQKNVKTDFDSIKTPLACKKLFPDQ